jgi:hypothetical protein
MLIIPGPYFLRIKFPSYNYFPKIDSPPVPLPAVKSPPNAINSGITLWNSDPFKWIGFPLFPIPFSPVHRHLKFSLVIGTISANNSISILSYLRSPINKSKYTFGFSFLSII